MCAEQAGHGTHSEQCCCFLKGEDRGAHYTHMQAAGVHAVQHVTHSLEDTPHPQGPADVHPARVDHHPQRGCTAQLRYELPHTVLHLWTRQVRVVSTCRDRHTQGFCQTSAEQLVQACTILCCTLLQVQQREHCLPPHPNALSQKPVTRVCRCAVAAFSVSDFQHSQHLPQAAQSLTRRASHDLSARPLCPPPSVPALTYV